MNSRQETFFFAYPSEPIGIGDVIERAAPQLPNLKTWQSIDIAGAFLATSVLREIESRSVLIADITRLNFNVTYEIGYAIGKHKRLILVRNRALKSDANLVSELGIFDTLGYLEYENTRQLKRIIDDHAGANPKIFDPTKINLRAPVYLLEPKHKTDAFTRIRSRVKRARLFYRSFDPYEQPRLSADDAITQVSTSAGVLLLLLSQENPDARLNNLRAAFLAGLAHGMRKVTTILQEGTGPVPLDYRDLAITFQHFGQINAAVAEFAVETTEALQAPSSFRSTRKRRFIESVSLGASSAENEFRELGSYYITTDQFLRSFRGEVRMVIGRKGSGKTALFAQLRDRVRQPQENVVVDLKPEGYKLRKFSESIGSLLTEGTYEHTVMAFWEYLLLLEICYKILEKDRLPHLRNHRIYEPYRRLEDLYRGDQYVREGDFSERMTVLLDRIVADHSKLQQKDRSDMLTEGQVTALIHRHDVRQLRIEITRYLKLKGSLWVLVDNLDKGWPAHGLEPQDLLVIRSLLEATRKLENDFLKAQIEAHAIVFLRNDVYEFLIRETSDRGKETRAVLDWTEPDLLREVLRRRIVVNLDNPDQHDFFDLWRQLCVSHIYGEESSQFLIDRCLMRPRWLIDLVSHCRAHAINLRHEKVEVEDVIAGLKSFSSDLLTDLGYEIRDVVADSDELLYAFLGVSPVLSKVEYEIVLAQEGFIEGTDDITEILLWYGFLGIGTSGENERYIPSVNYDMRRMKALIRRFADNVLYYVNPAFWPALEIQQKKNYV